jgi:hypothetical protein
MHHLREIIRPRFAEKLEPRFLLIKDHNGMKLVRKPKILSIRHLIGIRKKDGLPRNFLITLGLKTASN